MHFSALCCNWFQHCNTLLWQHGGFGASRSSAQCMHHVHKPCETGKEDGDVLQRWTKKSEGLAIQWMHNQVFPSEHRHSIPAASFQSDSRHWNTGSSEAQLYTCLKHAACICSIMQWWGNAGRKTQSWRFRLFCLRHVTLLQTLRSHPKITERTGVAYQFYKIWMVFLDFFLFFFFCKSR